MSLTQEQNGRSLPGEVTVVPSLSNGGGTAAPNEHSTGWSEHITHIRPRSAWSLLDIGELWQYRDLLIVLMQRDIKLRYRQTALGVIWVLLQPLLAVGIFSIVFGMIAKLPSNGYPYFILSFAGQLGWQAFSVILNRAHGCLLGNSHLVSKIYFPRLILPFALCGAGIIDISVSVAMMTIIMLVYKTFHLSVLLFPFLLLVIMTLALGIGLITASLSVQWRDVNHILPVFISILLYASAVQFTLQTALDRTPPFLHWIFIANPIVHLIEGVRWSLLGIGHLNIIGLLYSVVVSIGFLGVGLLVFKRMERRFADVI